MSQQCRQLLGYFKQTRKARVLIDCMGGKRHEPGGRVCLAISKRLQRQRLYERLKVAEATLKQHRDAHVSRK